MKRHPLAHLSLLLALAAVACGSSHRPEELMGNTGAGAADSGTPAVDAGRSDAGATIVTSTLVGQTDPLPSVRFAFKAGYHDKEQVWLIDDHDAVRQVPTGDISPAWTSSCCCGFSTGGYIERDGRFGELMFDPSGRYLLFRETIECHQGGGQSSRVLAYELSSGTTRVVLETEASVEMAASAVGVVAYVDHVEDQYPPAQTPDNPLPDVFVFADGAFERVAVPNEVGVHMTDWTYVYLEKLGDHELLLANDVAPLERAGGKWQRSALADKLVGLRLYSVGAAASGDRVCGIVERLDDMGTHVETLLWVYDAAGKWRSASVDPDSRSQTCGFSSDGSRVMFGSSELVFDSTTMKRLAPATTQSVDLFWPIGDTLYGLTSSDTRQIVRFDWSTLDTKGVPELAKLPALCSVSDRVIPVLVPPPDARDIALVKISCGCTDCDVSATLAWRRSSGELTTIEEPFMEHQVFGAGWPADGGAILLSTQSGSVGDDTQEMRPKPSSYFSIDAKAKVQTIGPLKGPVGVMHAPAVPPIASK